MSVPSLHCVEKVISDKGSFYTLLSNDYQFTSSTSLTISPSTPVPSPATPTTADDILITPPAPQYDTNKLAFMVETRPLPHLPAQYLHMSTLIPPEWPLLFMGSPESLSHMRASPPITNLEKSGRLRFLPIPPQYSLRDRETISQMFTDEHLYADILAPAEHLLIFQPDAIFCANSDQSLNDYLEWDWVGAPWSLTSTYGGNGGLSVRRISRILRAIREKGPRQHGDGALEDLWLTSKMREFEDWHMPNVTVSKRFSVESVWDDRPLGYHIGWLGVHHEQIWTEEWQIRHILEYCPEVKLVLGMKLVADKPEGVP